MTNPAEFEGEEGVDLLDVGDEPEEGGADAGPDDGDLEADGEIFNQQVAGGAEDDEEGDQAPVDNALAARLRIAEKRALQAERDRQLVEGRFEQLWSRFAAGDNPQPGNDDGANEDDLPDPELETEQYTRRKVERVERMLQEEREERKRQEQTANARREEEAIERTIVSYRSQHPEYDQALTYLVDQSLRELSTLHPDRTTSEIQRAVIEGANNRMREWHRTGANPGAQVIALAEARGWRPVVADPVPKKKAGTDAREEVRKQRDRQQRARTVGRQGGGGVRPSMSHKDALALSEEDYFEVVQGGGIGNSPRFRDLLADKLVTGVG